MPAGTEQHEGSVSSKEDPLLGLLGPRSRHLLTLEFGSKDQFDDPRLEWRRLFSELLGTFALVLVAAGGGILHGQGQISLSAAATFLKSLLRSRAASFREAREATRRFEIV